jgi:hypothetical protein
MIEGVTPNHERVVGRGKHPLYLERGNTATLHIVQIAPVHADPYLHLFFSAEPARLAQLARPAQRACTMCGRVGLFTPDCTWTVIAHAPGLSLWHSALAFCVVVLARLAQRARFLPIRRVVQCGHAPHDRLGAHLRQAGTVKRAQPNLGDLIKAALDKPVGVTTHIDIIHEETCISHTAPSNCDCKLRFEERT